MVGCDFKPKEGLGRAVFIGTPSQPSLERTCTSRWGWARRAYCPQSASPRAYLVSIMKFLPGGGRRGLDKITCTVIYMTYNAKSFHCFSPWEKHFQCALKVSSIRRVYWPPPSFTTEFMAENISIHDPNAQEVKPTSVRFERLFISEWSCGDFSRHSVVA